MEVADSFEFRGGTMYAGLRRSPDAQDLSLEGTLLGKQVREASKLYGADGVAVLMISFDEYANI